MSRRFWSGEAAKQAREVAGLKPEAVAEMVGVHRASVYGWEAGREPQMRHALGLADLYDVSIDSFFIHDADAPTNGGEAGADDHEVPAKQNAPAAVVAGAVNTGGREGVPD